jgi:hypothetical protein
MLKQGKEALMGTGREHILILFETFIAQEMVRKRPRLE